MILGIFFYEFKHGAFETVRLNDLRAFSELEYPAKKHRGYRYIGFYHYPPVSGCRESCVSVEVVKDVVNYLPPNCLRVSR